MEFPSMLDRIREADQVYLTMRDAPVNAAIKRATLAKLLQEQQSVAETQKLMQLLSPEQQLAVKGGAKLSDVLDVGGERGRAETLQAAVPFILSESRPEDVRGHLLSAEAQLGPRTERSTAIKAMTEVPKDESSPEIVKLMRIRDAYATKGDTRNAAAIDARIKHLQGAGGEEKMPTGLPQEAKLKWSLDKGYIDKETYDRAIRGTPGAKAEEKANIRKQDQLKSFKYLDTKFGEIENAMSDALGIDKQTLENALTVGQKSSADTLESAVGFIQGQFPDWAITQNRQNILSNIKRLQQLAQTGGLMDLRKAGVAPGSVTEKEWPKFQADLANLDTTLSGKELVKQFLRIYQKMQNSRISAQEEIQGMGDENVTVPSVAPTGATADSFLRKRGLK